MIRKFNNIQFRRKALAVVLVVSMVVTAFRQDEYDLNKCLFKYKSEWSRPCLQCKDYSKSYRAYFRNVCEEVLEVKLAAQEKDRRWKTYTFRDVQPGDTLVAYACKGTGKYLYWVKRPEDLQYVFPTDEEINESFTD
jgi:hypothetical protein